MGIGTDVLKQLGVDRQIVEADHFLQTDARRQQLSPPQVCLTACVIPDDQANCVTMRTAELQEILGNGLRLKKFRASAVECPLAASRPRKELRRPAEEITEISCAGECFTRLGGSEALHRDKNGASGALHLQFASVPR